MLCLRPTFFAFIFFALTQTAVNAQYTKVCNAPEWKKTVGRTLILPAGTDSGRYSLMQVSIDSTIFEMIVSRVKSKKIKAYAPFAPFENNEMSDSIFSNLFRDATDTTTVFNPTTSQEEPRIISIPFDYRSVSKYRIIEEWTYYPYTKKTEIAVSAIVFLQDFYGYDGELHGSKPIFAVKLGDVERDVAKYEQLHPESNLSMLIWENYFRSDVRPSVSEDK